MRVVFVNEGVLGPEMLGHESLDDSMRRALPESTGVEIGFLSLPPLDPRLARLTWDLPGLNRLDLDLQVSRWHAVQGIRARRMLRA